MDGFLYILVSQKNGRYYIGSTDNWDRRIFEHNFGKSPYTANILPVTPVFIQHYPTLEFARKAEKWLKKQKDRNLIEKIINEGKINRVFE